MGGRQRVELGENSHFLKRMVLISKGLVFIKMICFCIPKRKKERMGTTEEEKDLK